jgi:hypothetical protein
MDIIKLNQDLTQLVEKRNALSKISYSDEKYDELEEDLHELEDEFNDNFGDALENELAKIYEKLQSDNDVLLPTAYLANHYLPMLPDANGIITYEVKGLEGVPVESEQFQNQDVRIVLIPNPTRFVMQINGVSLKNLWVCK